MSKRLVDTEEPITRSDFARIMGQTLMRFAPDRGAEARETQQNQAMRWADVIRALFHALNQHSDPQAASEFGELFGEAVRTANVGIIQSDGAPMIQSDIPILTDDPTGRLAAFVHLDPWFALAAVVIGTATAVGEKLKVVQGRPGLDRLLRDPRLTRAYAELMEMSRVEPALLQIKGEIEQQLAAAIRAFAQRQGQVEASAQRSKEAYETLEQEARQALMVASSERQGAIDAIRSEWAAFYEASVAELDATKRRVTEQAVLYKAHELWSRKAAIHAISFGVGLGLIAITVLAGVGTVLWFGPTYLAELPRKLDGEVSYISVAMLTVSAIAIGWLLRFVGRYVIENMVMQADAAQRKTMIQTYLALVGIKEANVEQADRTLILNAIFRPLPGHQSEDVAPPTLLDVMKSATGKG